MISLININILILFNRLSYINSLCSCIPPLFCYEDQCVISCPPKFSQDISTQTCINCASKSLYLYLGNCVPFELLPIGTYISDSQYNIIDQCSPICRTCELQADHCRECSSADNASCIVYCHSNEFPNGKPLKCIECYKTCSTCNKGGFASLHNCNTCKNDYESFTSPMIECHKKCNDATIQRWIIDKNSRYFCIEGTECPIKYSLYVKETNQCVTSCAKGTTCVQCNSLSNGMFEYKGECYSLCPNSTIENLLNNSCDEKHNDLLPSLPLDDLLNKIHNEMPKVNLSLIIENDYVIEIYNSSSKGGNDGKSNRSTLIFEQCEKNLRKEYNISDNEVLLIIKVDINRSNAITNQVEYCIYDQNGKLLNLDYCINDTAIIVTPINNSSLFDLDTAKEFKKLGIDIYNPQDPFFKDICFPFTADKGTDIILRDRLKDIYKNISLCEANCDYDSIDLENHAVKCICQIKSKVNIVTEPNVFIDAITTVFTESNFMVFTCYKIAFDSNITLINVGFWFYLLFIVLHLPNWVYYFIKGLRPIMDYIKEYSKTSPSPPKVERKKDDRLKEGIKYLNSGNQIRTVTDRRDTQRSASKSLMLEKIQLNNIISKKQHYNLRSIYIRNDLEKSLASSQWHCEDDDSDYNKDQCTATHKDYSKHNSAMSYSSFNNNKQNSPNQHKHLTDNIYKIPKQINESFTNTTIPSTFQRQHKRFNTVAMHSNYINTHSIKSQMKNTSLNAISEVNISYDKQSKGSQQIFFNSSRFNKNKQTTKSINDTNKTGVLVTTVFTDSQYKTTTSQAINYNNINPTDNQNNIIIPTITTTNAPSMDILDDYDLHSAKKNDTRSFCRLLYICLKLRHPILSTFVKEWELDLRCIIIILFLFGIIIDFAFNAFFFTDQLISNRYNYKGYLSIVFTIGNNIVAAIASYAVSALLMFFLSKLSSNQSQFEMYLKTQRKLKNQRHLLRHAVRCYKIKLALFIIIELLLFMLCWYYTMAFCAVYQNSQWEWLTSGCITFIIGLCIPVPISIIIVLLRSFAIEREIEWLFKFAIWCYKL